MKTLLALILTATIAVGQTTGDYLLTRKAATGYTQKTLTPENGKSLGWDSSGNPVNIAPVTSLSWDAISSKPSTFAPSSHTHPLSEISQSSATSGQVATWNGSAWAAQSPSGSFILAPNTSKKLAEMADAGGASQLVVMSVGDSLGRRVFDGYNGSIVAAGLKDLCGKRIHTVGYALSSLKYTTQSGTISYPADASDAGYAASVALWDTANVWTMSSGAEQRIGFLQSSASVGNIKTNSVAVYLVNKSGGGTASIDYSVDGGSTWTNLGSVSTNGTTGPNVFTSTAAGMGGKPLILRIVASGGTVIHCGAKMVNTAENGIVWAGTYMPSAALSDMNSANSAIRTAILSDLAPTFILAHMWEGSSSQSIVDTFVSNWLTAASSADLCVVEQYPTSSNDTVAATMNGYWRAASITNPKVSLVPTETILGNTAKLDALGWGRIQFTLIKTHGT